MHVLLDSDGKKTALRAGDTIVWRSDQALSFFRGVRPLTVVSASGHHDDRASVVLEMPDQMKVVLTRLIAATHGFGLEEAPEFCFNTSLFSGAHSSSDLSCWAYRLTEK